MTAATTVPAAAAVVGCEITGGPSARRPGDGLGADPAGAALGAAALGRRRAHRRGRLPADHGAVHRHGESTRRAAEVGDGHVRAGIHAADGEILVSSTAKDLAAGSEDIPQPPAPVRGPLPGLSRGGARSSISGGGPGGPPPNGVDQYGGGPSS